MTLFTKFPRTKFFAIAVSLLATAIVWSALAWPDWTAANTNKTYGSPDPQVEALRALAALPPQQRAALAAPTAPAPTPAARQVVHQTVVIKRTVGSPVHIVTDDGAPAGDTQYAAATANSSAAPAANPTGGTSAPPPPAGSAPKPDAPAGKPAPAPAPPDANVPSAPPPPAPTAPSAPAPVPTTPPPPPPAPPPPAPVATPTRTKAS